MSLLKSAPGMILVELQNNLAGVIFPLTTLNTVIPAMGEQIILHPVPDPPGVIRGNGNSTGCRSYCIPFPIHLV